MPPQVSGLVTAILSHSCHAALPRNRPICSPSAARSAAGADRHGWVRLTEAGQAHHLVRLIGYGPQDRASQAVVHSTDPAWPRGQAGACAQPDFAMVVTSSGTPYLEGSISSFPHPTPCASRLHYGARPLSRPVLSGRGFCVTSRSQRYQSCPSGSCGAATRTRAWSA